MSKQLFLNNFEWTFIANVKSTPSTGTPDTELGYGILQIGSAASAFLTNPTGGDWYMLTALKRSGSVESQYEIIKVLGVDEAGYVAGGECRIRVSRAQEGTTAQAYVSGDFIALRLTKGGAAGFMQATDNLTGIADASVARTNLGLGTAAVTNTGTGATNTILGNDARLTDSRAPTGAAGGVLAGTYPNPSFSADMATQAELDAVAAAKQATLVSGTNIKTVGGVSVLGSGDIGTLGVGYGGTGTTTSTGTGATVRDTSPTLVTPLLGTPTSGNLSNCTADGTNSVGYKNIPQNSQSTAYTLVLADAGKHILHPSADTTARTMTIPANSSVAYPIGTALTFVNQASAGVMTIAINTDTMRLAGAGTTGSRTLAANGIATALKLTATEWIISGTGLT